VANIYMNLYQRSRVQVRKERAIASAQEAHSHGQHAA